MMIKARTIILIMIPIIVCGYGEPDGEHIIKKRDMIKKRAAQAEQVEARNKSELAALRNMPALENDNPTLLQIQGYLFKVQAYLESNSTNGIGQVVRRDGRGRSPRPGRNR